MDYRRLHRQSGATARPTILVVDDQVDLRDAIAEQLETEGYDVVDASNGDEALKYLSSAANHVAAIVLDLAMPVMDGWQFLAERQKHAGLKDIPTIVVTGVSEATRRHDELGDIVVFTKPFHFDDLIRELRQALEAHKRAKPAAVDVQQ